MTEKDMMQMNEQSLEQVAGGFGFDYQMQKQFLKQPTSQAAIAFLARYGIYHDHPNFHYWMQMWQAEHK